MFFQYLQYYTLSLKVLHHQLPLYRHIIHDFTRLRHFEFLSISADHFRLLPQAAQGTGIFTVFYAEMFKLEL